VKQVSTSAILCARGATILRIGVLSDTHIPVRARELPDELLQAFARVDLILHAGDLNTLAVLATLRKLAPVVAVAGNTDGPAVQHALGWRQIVAAGGCQIGLVHGDRGPGAGTIQRAQGAFAKDSVNAIVFGHSHVPYNHVAGDVLLFNPGSATDRRRQAQCSFGLLTVAEGRVRGEVILTST
jgi:putative phosphoesterase